MTATLSNSLLDSILACWFPEGADAVSSRLPGGDLNDVFRVEKDGQAYALRLYTRTSTRDMVSEEQEVVRCICDSDESRHSVGSAVQLWSPPEGRRC